MKTLALALCLCCPGECPLPGAPGSAPDPNPRSASGLYPDFSWGGQPGQAWFGPAGDYRHDYNGTRYEGYWGVRGGRLWVREQNTSLGPAAPWVPWEVPLTAGKPASGQTEYDGAPADVDFGKKAN